MELFIHPAFAGSEPFVLDLDAVQWNLQGVDDVLDLLREKAGIDIAGDIAGNQAKSDQIVENQFKIILEGLSAHQAGDIARGMAEGISEKMVQVLSMALFPIERKELLKGISLVSNVRNFNACMAPLVAVSWIAMTIPDKPTSPHRKHLTTLKGRLVLELLWRYSKQVPPTPTAC